ncbi:MAG: VWA domain-containing protein [Bacteroidota bacterium]
MKKTYVYIFLFCLSGSLSFSQEVVRKGRLLAKDTFDLSVIRVFPDSFPDISIVFKAENKSGIPLWNLTKDQVTVKEDSLDCSVVFFDKITRQKPVLMQFVIDHSGSMKDDRNALYYPDGSPRYEDTQGNIYPPGYQSPLTKAKNAVLAVLKDIDFAKDSVGLIGFSDTPDIVQNLTSDVNKLKYKLSLMSETNGTAFYDAVALALDKLKKSDNIRAVIALTDGQDNQSVISKKGLIKKARKLGIPVYIIGLGDVNKAELKLLTEQMGGEFHYTSSSGSLGKIYRQITNKIMAVYELVYRSGNLASSDSIRETLISFDIDSVFLTGNLIRIGLPKDVVKKLRQREAENEKKAEEVQQTVEDLDADDDLLNWVGIYAAVCLAGAGSIVMFRRWKKSSKTNDFVGQVYPNPSSGEIKLPYKLSGNAYTVCVRDIHGKLLKKLALQGGAGELQLDLGNYKNGNYFIKVSNGQGFDEVRRVIILN